MGLSTHVLDTARGEPGAGVGVLLERTGSTPGVWEQLGAAVTDAEGRAALLDGVVPPGTYRVVFDTGGHDAAQGRTGLYPVVSVVLSVADPTEHLHVPLLLSPFGYTTYRGS